MSCAPWGRRDLLVNSRDSSGRVEMLCGVVKLLKATEVHIGHYPYE